MEIGFAFRTATLTSSRTVVLFSKISSWCITNHNVRITKHHDVFRAFGLGSDSFEQLDRPKVCPFVELCRTPRDRSSRCEIIARENRSVGVVRTRRMGQAWRLSHLRVERNLERCNSQRHDGLAGSHVKAHDSAH